MVNQEITEKLLNARKQKGLTFADLEKELGRDEVWIAALFYRQASASREEAEKLAAALDLEPDPKGDRVRVTMSGKFLPYKKW
jgi:cyanate lyase